MPPKIVRRGNARRIVGYQFGGARRGKNGLEYRIIPMVMDSKGQVRPHLGGAFWDRALKWVKGAANTVAKAAKPLVNVAHDAIKKSGLVSKAASSIPGIGPVAGAVARHYGYGYGEGQAGGRRVVKRGNAMKAAR